MADPAEFHMRLTADEARIRRLRNAERFPSPTSSDNEPVPEQTAEVRATCEI